MPADPGRADDNACLALLGRHVPERRKRLGRAFHVVGQETGVGQVGRRACQDVGRPVVLSPLSEEGNGAAGLGLGLLRVPMSSAVVLLDMASRSSEKPNSPPTSSCSSSRVS
ncbi:hypothetical protein [Streptomyces sp. E5N91]|uniref:hypothetical protein n=1 Tax=Streptomyces sp. E5N91 TaxID=1851996 RepID=UPI00187D1716|nr:hypothetical protein [Streptomyces sp. E5N91]